MNNNPYGLYIGAITFIVLGIIKFIQDSRRDKKNREVRQEEDDIQRYIEKIKTEVYDDIDKLNGKLEKAVDKDIIERIFKRLDNLSERISKMEGSFDMFFNIKFKPQHKRGPGSGDYGEGGD